MSYTEKVYATDSYQLEQVSGKPDKIIRGSSLKAYAKYSGVGEAILSGTSGYSRIQVTNSGSKAYPKKRISKIETYVYITARSTSGSGRLPAGLFVHYAPNMYPDSSFNTQMGNTWSSYLYPVASLPVNDYTCFASIDSGPSEYRGTVAVNCGCTENIYTDITYNVQASITVDSHTGTNKPYTIYTYEDVIPRAEECYPASGFVNEKAANTFGWKFAYNNWDSNRSEYIVLKQASARFRWRAKGASSHTEIAVSGNAQTITIPANTFTTAAIEWQVAVKSDDNVESAFTEWMELTTVDKPCTAEIVSPKSIYIDGAKGNTFSWNHIVETGSPQSKYETQYSTDNGASWKAIKTETTSRLSAQVAANFFAAGSILWRVRTWNSDNVAGTWSATATVVVRSVPAKPSITSLDAKPRPTVKWQANGQQAFQVQAGTYDSGPQFGTDKTHHIPVYLPNGSVTIRVRVQNNFGLWSEWTAANTMIQNVPGPAIQLYARAGRNNINLSWSTSGYASYYILRDGIPIFKTAGKEYTDHTARGKHVYQVMGITAADNYGTSAEAVEILLVEDAQIAVIGTYDWLSLRYRRDAYPGHRRTAAQDVSYQHYDGRKKPVAQLSKFVDITRRFDFTLKTPNDIAQLEGMLGKLILYRDCHGRCCAGMLESLEEDLDWAADVSFTITETDWKEEIPYDIP